MANDTRLREFTWAGMTFGHLIPTGGFSWRVDLVRNSEQPGSPLPGNERGPWLTAAGYSGPHCGGQEYRLDAPLRRSRSDIGLHRDFASLSPVAILAFANQYGPLGHGEMLVDPAGSSEQDSPYGESFEFWRRQIQKMAALVRTWDLARREETGDTHPPGQVDPAGTSGPTARSGWRSPSRRGSPGGLKLPSRGVSTRYSIQFAPSWHCT